MYCTRLFFPRRVSVYSSLIFRSVTDLGTYFEGMHCLELAKTFWNSAVATDSGFSDHETLLTSARHFLSLAQEALSIFSSEGDIDVGPVIEANMLKQLLD